jgi:hypothetical protein
LGRGVARFGSVEQGSPSTADVFTHSGAQPKRAVVTASFEPRLELPLAGKGLVTDRTGAPSSRKVRQGQIQPRLAQCECAEALRPHCRIVEMVSLGARSRNYSPRSLNCAFSTGHRVRGASSPAVAPIVVLQSPLSRLRSSGRCPGLVPCLRGGLPLPQGRAVRFSIDPRLPLVPASNSGSPLRSATRAAPHSLAPGASRPVDPRAPRTARFSAPWCNPSRPTCTYLRRQSRCRPVLSPFA